MARKVMTLVVLYNPTQVLLAMKKRGFGQGRFNGFGGKVHEGETIEQAAHRELQEESTITGVILEPAGNILFVFSDGKEFDIHLFRNAAFSGEGQETEEMKPQWFTHAEVPFDQMWPDDRHWLPQFLQGKKPNGTVWFADENTIIKTELSFS